MATHEEQDQCVVGVIWSLRGTSLLPKHLPPRNGVLAASASLLTAQQIGETVGGDRDQPGLWVVRADASERRNTRQ
jgi:hypothetical protein